MISSFITFMVNKITFSAKKTSVVVFGIKDKQLRFILFFNVFLILLEELPCHEELL